MINTTRANKNWNSVNETNSDYQKLFFFINFYKENYPDKGAEHEANILKAIEGIKIAYHQNTFPEMNVRWDAYPNHKSHMATQGCFRCQDNNHSTKDGRIISKDCNLCNYITAQGKPDSLQMAFTNQKMEKTVMQRIVVTDK